MLSFYQIIILSIITCYCILNTHKNYGVKNAIILTISGITLALSYSLFYQYIIQNLDETTTIITIIILIGSLIGLSFWKNNKKEK